MKSDENRLARNLKMIQDETDQPGSQTSNLLSEAMYIKLYCLLLREVEYVIIILKATLIHNFQPFLMSDLANARPFIITWRM